jgi:hypothetical protein
MCWRVCRGRVTPSAAAGFSFCVKHQSSRVLCAQAPPDGGARPHHVAAARQQDECAGAWRRTHKHIVNICRCTRARSRQGASTGSRPRERQRSAARAAPRRRQAARCASLLRGAPALRSSGGATSVTSRGGRVRGAACCGALRRRADRTSEGAGTVGDGSPAVKRTRRARARHDRARGAGACDLLLASDAPPPGAPLS